MMGDDVQTLIFLFRWAQPEPPCGPDQGYWTSGKQAMCDIRVGNCDDHVASVYDANVFLSFPAIIDPWQYTPPPKKKKSIALEINLQCTLLENIKTTLKMLNLKLMSTNLHLNWHMSRKVPSDWSNSYIEILCVNAWHLWYCARFVLWHILDINARSDAGVAHVFIVHFYFFSSAYNEAIWHNRWIYDASGLFFFCFLQSGKASYGIFTSFITQSPGILHVWNPW